MVTGQYNIFTYMLSFGSIKGILRFEAKTVTVQIASKALNIFPERKKLYIK
jgi:hypothetical protein